MGQFTDIGFGVFIRWLAHKIDRWRDRRRRARL